MPKLLLDISDVSTVLKKSCRKGGTKFVKIPLAAVRSFPATLLDLLEHSNAASTVQACSYCNPLTLAEHLPVRFTVPSRKHQGSRRGFDNHPERLYQVTWNGD